MTHADLIIIGAGPGGYELAARAASMNLDVILIEKDRLGGTCLNRGCIPTKALCSSAAAVEAVRSASEFGVVCRDYAVDVPAVMARKDSVVAQLAEGVATLLSKVKIIRGEAVMAADGSVVVNDEAFEATKVVIATGSRPALPPVEGIASALTSDQLLEMQSFPESIIIIGGGVIGMEFASLLTSFGTKVTVIEYCREIIPALDAEVAKRLRMVLKRRGVTVVTSAQVTSVTRTANEVTVSYTEKGKEKTVTAAEVAVTTGRKAVVPDGFTAAGGVLDSRGFIVTADDFSTSIPGVYAVGDVNGKCMLAHAATAQALSIIGEAKQLAAMPSAVFTIPECAMVGATEDRCAADGIDFAVGKSTFRANGKALASGETDGMVKIIVDRASGRILGCHICGPHASDLIQEITVAMAADLTAAQVAATIHPHPTLSEAIAAALMNF